MRNERMGHGLDTASQSNPSAQTNLDLCEFCLNLVACIARPKQRPWARVPDQIRNLGKGKIGYRHEFTKPKPSACYLCESIMGVLDPQKPKFHLIRTESSLHSEEGLICSVEVTDDWLGGSTMAIWAEKGTSAAFTPFTHNVDQSAYD
jgi:hypothetical protein